MNILCNEGGFVGKFVNREYLGLLRGRHCYEGASPPPQMREHWQLWIYPYIYPILGKG